MIGDDDIPVHVVTDDEREAFYEEYEPGTPVVFQEPSSMPIPTVKAALSTDARLDRVERELGVLLAGRKTQIRILGLIASALFGALVTISLYATDKISSSSERVGATSATLQALEKRMDALEAAIARLAEQLWSLHKQGKIDPLPPTSGPDRPQREDGENSDRVSLLDGGHGADGAASGVIVVQLPNEQTGQVRTMPWHSMFPLQTLPQVVSGLISCTTAVPSARVDRRATIPRLIPLTSSSSMSEPDVGALAGGSLEAAVQAEIMIASRNTRMPYVYTDSVIPRPWARERQDP